MLTEAQEDIMFAAFEIVGSEKTIARYEEDLAEIENPRRRGHYAFEERAARAKRELPHLKASLAEAKRDFAKLTPLSAREAINAICAQQGKPPRFAL